jgi:SAM-dependent methyltransferase
VKLCLSCEHRFDSPDWACPSCGWAPAGDGQPRFAPELATGDDGFVEESFELLATMEQSSFWFRSRNDLIAWAVMEYFSRAESLLEVGCGTGFVLAGLRHRFPSVHFVGGELFDAGLAVSRRRLPGIPLLQMDARHIPFAAEFDVVAAFDVLEHIDEDEEVIRQLRQATKPGGGVIITVPQHARLWSAVDDFSRHRRRYTRQELVHKLESAGLSVVRTTSFVTLLLPALLASRLLHRRDREFDPETEFRMAARTDAALERIMGLERRLIRRGASLPVGGSLLAIAARPE